MARVSQTRLGGAWQGTAGHDRARQGTAEHGRAWLGGQLGGRLAMSPWISATAKGDFPGCSHCVLPVFELL